MEKNFKKKRSVLWIFCEGKAEERYFQNLRHIERKKELSIKTKVTQNKRCDLIVEEAISFKKNPDYEEGDILACVFDRDNNTNKELDSAAESSKKEDIKIYFSNSCFEIWLLAHFQECSGLEPGEAYSALKKHLDSKCETDLYELTKDKLHNAVSRCQNYEKNLAKKQIKLLSIHSNPSSQVYRLVEFINNFR